MNPPTVTCGNCGGPITDRPDMVGAERQPCPACGSTTRVFAQTMSVTGRGTASVSAVAHRGEALAAAALGLSDLPEREQREALSAALGIFGAVGSVGVSVAATEGARWLWGSVAVFAATFVGMWTAPGKRVLVKIGHRFLRPPD